MSVVSLAARIARLEQMQQGAAQFVVNWDPDGSLGPLPVDGGVCAALPEVCKSANDWLTKYSKG